MNKSTESSKQFISVLRSWQKLEDSTVKSAEALAAKTSNSLVKATMEMIRHDSEKHKGLLQMLIDSLTKEAITLSPDALIGLSKLLNKHLEIEAKSLELAKTARKDARLFSTKFILTYILADETKHHTMISQLLSELKKASISTSTGSRRSKGD